MNRIYTLITALLLLMSSSYGQTKLMDVWDFGAEQLDKTLYENQLTVDIINSWYPSTITAGTQGPVFPSKFTAGALSWTGGSSDRLRTTNTALTRYDQNLAATGYTGRLYVNGAAQTGRYLSLTLEEDDEVSMVIKTDNGGKINFQYETDPTSQTDIVTVPAEIGTLKFTAKKKGVYRVFDSVGKPSYFRIIRKSADYATISGTIDATSPTNIPAGYAITLTNSAGKTWTSTVTDNAFTAKVPAGYTYSLSLSNADGYIISNGKTLEVTTATTTYNVAIIKLDLYTVTGTISGLGTDISKLSLTYSADPLAAKVFTPAPVINTTDGTYTVQLEANCNYTITATGVNDYQITAGTINIGQENTTANIEFTAKPTNNVVITTSGLTPEQKGKLSLTFSNLNEVNYKYTFKKSDAIALRNGVYSITTSGLDEYPYQLGLTSNLTVAGEATSKQLTFSPVTNWSFNDATIINGTTTYKGVQFTGSLSNEIAKGHLLAKPAATIKVPVNVGEKMIVTYYYSADFTINEGIRVTTASNSTNTLETTSYIYTGTEAGYATITIGTGAVTTYITDITTEKAVDYKSVIYVGTDKEYTTINDALTAIAQMKRTGSERVTVMIDPGNYEEMLVITEANVTLKNAAVTPSIAITNKGVDIDANAVRITSYYGLGYNYFSMGTNQKWNADVLRVNKENGYYSSQNQEGTTNGSYWNATVVVSANGFEAENLILENSYNQYISQKESEDILSLGTGNKGVRPTTYGDVTVQNKAFVERAAAIAITNNTDKVVLNNCRVIGRQDSFYGGVGARIVVYKGAMMGGTDYIFGGMNAVFYQTDLVMNTSDDAKDLCYITAAQQSSGRGYLMYECTITSATPQIETASTYRSKPGYYGRPWKAATSEVVFYNTKIETSNYTGSEGKSLIMAAGWLNTLSGESAGMCEYGTTEESGETNQASRASWATVLKSAALTDGTEISTFNFTKGTDNWDPIAALKAADVNTELPIESESQIKIAGYNGVINISNVISKTQIEIYNSVGMRIYSNEIESDITIPANKGLWIISTSSNEGRKTEKVFVR